MQIKDISERDLQCFQNFLRPLFENDQIGLLSSLKLFYGPFLASKLWRFRELGKPIRSSKDEVKDESSFEKLENLFRKYHCFASNFFESFI